MAVRSGHARPARKSFRARRQSTTGRRRRARINAEIITVVAARTSVGSRSRNDDVTAGRVRVAVTPAVWRATGAKIVTGSRLSPRDEAAAVAMAALFAHPAAASVPF